MSNINKFVNDVHSTVKKWNNSYPTLGEIAGKFESWGRDMERMKAFKASNHPSFFRALNIIKSAYDNRDDRQKMLKAAENVLEELKLIDENFTEPAKAKYGSRTKMQDNTELAGQYAFLGYDNVDVRNLDTIQEQIRGISYRQPDEISTSHIKSIVNDIRSIQDGYIKQRNIYETLEELSRGLEQAAQHARVKSARNTQIAREIFNNSDRLITRAKTLIYENDKPSGFKSDLGTSSIRRIENIYNEFSRNRNAIKFIRAGEVLSKARKAFTDTHDVLSQHDEKRYNRMMNEAIKSLSSAVRVYNATPNKDSLWGNRDFVREYENAMKWYDELISEVRSKK